jgi:Tfp pilus assembly protein PilP
MMRALISTILVLSALTSISAQSNPPAQAPAAAQPAPLVPEPVEAAPQPPYKYDAEGRRDPFLSLVGRGSDPRLPVSRPSGVPGLSIGEVTVKGIIRDRSGFLAMIEAPDNKTYVVRAGAKLFDGSVKSIAADKVIFSQDVTDPLSLVKQREIPKAVRPVDGRGASPAS